MNEFLKRQVEVSTTATPTGSAGAVVVTTTGDKYIYTPAAPIRLRKWGIVFSTSLSTGAGGLILKLDYRPTAGSDTARVNKDTLTVAINNTTYVAGKGVYRDPYTTSAQTTGNDNSTVYSGQTDIVFKPGEQLVIQVDTAASTTGQGFLWVEFDVLPISKPSGYGTTDAGTVSLTENLTRFAS